MLLHSPPFAAGWNSLLGAVRKDLLLPRRLIELATCAVAALNRAEYQWQQHAPLYVEACGGGCGTPAIATGEAADSDASDLAQAAAAGAPTRAEGRHYSGAESPAGGAGGQAAAPAASRARAQLEAIWADPVGAAADGALFDSTDRAALALTAEITRDVRVRDETFAAARAALGGDRAALELVGVAAAYNMVSRLLVATGVGLEGGR